MPVSRDGSAADDDRCGQLRQPRVDRHLPDGRLLGQPVQVREELRLPGEERVASRSEPLRVIPRRRDADRLGERGEREDEGDDDAAEDEGQPARPPPSADRATDAAARKRRRLDGSGAVGQERGTRSGAGVDGHALLAEREAEARRARVEERERIRLRRDAEAVDIELLVGRIVATLGLALVELVLPPPVRATPTGLVTLAHGFLLSVSGSW